MSKTANADRSTMPTRSRIARCSALMIGDHQRESHSYRPGITRSPHSSSTGLLGAYQSRHAPLAVVIGQQLVRRLPVRPFPPGRFEEDRSKPLLALVEPAEPHAPIG